MNIGFIIPTCCNNNIHLKQLNRCINSIRQFYPTIHIILINDSNEKYDLNNIFKNDENIHIIQSYNKGSADQQLFYVLLETDLFDKAILMQDSMLLNKKLDNLELIDFKFIWHFTNHRVHWDIPQEPQTEYNILNSIVTHTDLIKHNILRDYSDNSNFIIFALDRLKYKDKWTGCFGSLCILNKEILHKLNNTVNFIDIFIKSNTNRDRRANESIFSLICYYYFDNNNLENSYDGLYYDGFIHGGNSKLINTNTGFDNLKWCAVHNYFSKISFNR